MNRKSCRCSHPNLNKVAIRVIHPCSPSCSVQCLLLCKPRDLVWFARNWPKSIFLQCEPVQPGSEHCAISTWVLGFAYLRCNLEFCCCRNFPESDLYFSQGLFFFFYYKSNKYPIWISRNNSLTFCFFFFKVFRFCIGDGGGGEQLWIQVCVLTKSCTSMGWPRSARFLEFLCWMQFLSWLHICVCFDVILISWCVFLSAVRQPVCSGKHQISLKSFQSRCSRG